jgi:hypothetical protein
MEGKSINRKEGRMEGLYGKEGPWWRVYMGRKDHGKEGRN